MMGVQWPICGGLFLTQIVLSKVVGVERLIIFEGEKAGLRPAFFRVRR
mgnify:CR=1 FL=1